MSRFKRFIRMIASRFVAGLNPFQPRIGWFRRIASSLVLLLLLVLIGAYFYVNHSDRVRSLAERYLSDRVGGQVHVGSIHLSLVRGLKLTGVTLATPGESGPDSLIFTAKMMRVEFNFPALWDGKFQLTRLVVIQPHIRLVRNLDTKQMNYQRLLHARKSTGPRQSSQNRPTLPAMIIKNGELESGQIAGGKYTELSSTWFDGRLSSAGKQGRSYFNLQSHTSGQQAPGPELAGWFSPETGQVELALRGIEFGPQLQAMLPDAVRNWCRQRQLSGRLSIDRFSFIPSRGHAPPIFDVQMHLETARLSLPARQWRSHDENQAVDQLRQTLADMQPMGITSDSLLARLTRFAEAPPVELDDLHGDFDFSSAHGVEISGLHGLVQGNPIELRGHITDYSAESPFHFELRSPENHLIHLADHPKYIRSLPVAVEEIYDRFKPRGTCQINLTIDRPAAGGKIAVAGSINIIDGQFVCDHFTYPLRLVHGRLLIQHDPATNQQSLIVDNITGQGIAGGPNADSHVHIAGTVAPFTHKCHVQLRISGTNVSSEPALIAALPPETQQALKQLDAPGHGQYPVFHGNFLCLVERPPVEHAHWTVATDLDIDRASARLKVFPYPLDNVSLQLHVRHNHVDIINAQMRRGQESLTVNGAISWKKSGPYNSTDKIHPALTISARNVPINQSLLQALPKQQAGWIRQIGLTGNMDMDGTIADAPDHHVAENFRINLHDGKLLPAANGQYAVTAIEANTHLTTGKLEIQQLNAHRLAATIQCKGAIVWSGDHPQIQLTGSANDVLLDPSLHSLLPTPAQNAWNWLDPAGTVNLQFVYNHHDTSGLSKDLSLNIQPDHLSLTPHALPYRLDQLSGSATLSNGQVVLHQMTARHGPATLSLDGSGSFSPVDWQLRLKGQHINVDQQLISAAPKPLADIISSLHLKGIFNFDFQKLSIKADPSQKTAAIQTDFMASISTPGASIQAGLPVSDIVGACTLTGGYHDGHATDLTGQFNLDSLNIDGRSATAVGFKLKKSASQPIVALYDLNASLAGGTMAGQLSVASPPRQPSHYTLGLILQDADLAQLIPAMGRSMHGSLNASIDLEGDWSVPASRRGRGDVLVTGKDLYNMPILLGVSQIANLSLPISHPFTQGTARYAVQGNMITFDSIELRAANMLMSGSGQMDFATKKFNLSFTTSNPSWPTLPIISELVRGAEHELFQIHVTGTIHEPKVSAGLLGVVPTTIDQVIGKKTGTPPGHATH